MTALTKLNQKEIITREQAIEMAMENYTDDTLQDDIVESLENDDRVADIREEIERSLMQEKNDELEHMSNEELLFEAGLVDEFEIETDQNASA